MATPIEKGNHVKFKCSVDGCFKEYNELKRHTDKIHLGINFGCNCCSRTFMSKHDRDGHIVSAHALKNTFQCQQCPSKFLTANHLQKHRRAHSDQKPHECTICSKRFKLKHQLRRHKEALHNQSRTKNFECSICQKKFFTKGHLSRHSLTHDQDGATFGCYFCRKMFITRCKLENHIRTHTQEKPFSCRVESCQYSCSNSNHLTRHTTACHPTGERPLSKIWSCYFCSKTFRSTPHFGNHMRTHTLETPFTCGLCRKKFESQARLKYHISIHTTEKPFKCEECGKCFIASCDLQRHIRAVHRGEKRFFCKFCSFSSYAISNFNTHSLRAHDKIV